jgi:hypothetical protein
VRSDIGDIRLLGQNSRKNSSRETPEASMI